MPTASSVQPGSWVPSTHARDSSGRAFNAATIKACQGSDPTQACQAALGRLHLRDLITYQPASRFWPLQWHETAIFLGLAAILAGVCLWRIRRQAFRAAAAMRPALIVDVPYVRTRPAGPGRRR